MREKKRRVTRRTKREKTRTAKVRVCFLFFLLSIIYCRCFDLVLFSTLIFIVGIHDELRSSVICCRSGCGFSLVAFLVRTLVRRTMLQNSTWLCFCRGGALSSASLVGRCQGPRLSGGVAAA